jgi:anthranilate phosphoribosyltransferase
MIKEAIQNLVEGRSLNMDQAAQVMNEIMEGQVTPAQLGAFVTALRMKGETVEEIAGLARTMRTKAVRVNTTVPVVDTCGTGGDGASTFNISTAAAFVAAGAGMKVAKHGNRAMSSKCGSADVLEALGININLNAEQVEKCLQEVGIGFIFAPSFHPSMKYAAGPRREIGFRTVFNILGPLTNPAGAKAQVIGVPSEKLGQKMSRALELLGTNHALVVHGTDGIDEISITGHSRIWEIGNDIVVDYFISPDDFGFEKSSLKEIAGGTAEDNARILRAVLSGEKGPRRDVTIMNAAAAIMAGGKMNNGNGTGGVKQLVECARIAGEAIDSGHALEKLELLIKTTQSFK